ncbi:hypothetical protein HNO92_002372 [Chromobacterium alkanivorans]|uniref:hypothetical protein n=1 Tax=Chromobacterium TaxID=535 RepID=UPI000653EDCB|nr:MULTISPECIES: hypothetical protein [Chromobacterium]KMN80008.1 hypothetical protein VK98_16555 [Chromobacterium sp. LK11]MBN3004681.1 hypothetical protein [Chromobacterium alkanivorans]MCS3804891.1 hypothetical protein [Chromobacterium alkanivorans]MCS3819546.1 hypothetical protein [Chromobacterium alkanivorans]MCS3874058.1 hypothetical protein [Chromobacterium alkanivorans]
MNAKQRKWLALGGALLLLGGLKFGLIYRWYGERQPAKPTPLACAAGQPSCALPGGGVWRFASPPQHGKPFEIRLQGVAAREAPQVEFNMADMDMGFNRYTFVRDGADWKAVVTLPLCVSGSRDWLATLSLDGKRYLLPFSTR